MKILGFVNEASTQPLATLLISLVLSAVASGQPVLTVLDQGDNGSGNRRWLVQVAPDSALFTNGQGSLTVELGLSVTGSSIVSATKSSLWPFNNPGFNPFTDSLSFGLNVNTGGDGNIYAALGSNLFMSGAPVTLLTIDTSGLASTTLSWGGQTVNAPQPFIGGRISQGGLLFDNYMGSLTTGGPPCDFNASTTCTIDDLDLLYAALGTSNATFDLNGTGTVDNDDITQWLADASSVDSQSRTFVRGDIDLNGSVLGSDFTALAANFGSSGGWSLGNFNDDGVVGGSDFTALASNFGFTSLSAVPEPSLVVVTFVGLVSLLPMLRRNAVSVR